MRSCFTLLLVSLLLPHIGIENSYFEGNVGSYSTRIIIEPPGVVPGLASIKIFSIDREVESVSVRAVHNNAITRDTLNTFNVKPDVVPKSDQVDNMFQTDLWLMDYGAYGVEVFFDGSKGKSNVIVPVNSISSKMIEMSQFMSTTLWFLLILLFVGGVNIIGTAYYESTLEINQNPNKVKLKKTYIVYALSSVILFFMVYGGYNWWVGIEKQFMERFYKPFDTSLNVKNNILNISIDSPPKDASWLDKQGTIREHGKLILEHNKLAHIYIFDEEKKSFMAHLHPINLIDDYEFETCLPSMAEGNYVMYADLAHQNGFSHSITESFELKNSIENPEFNKSLCDPDNSYSNFNQTSVDINWTNQKENYNLSDNIGFDLEISNDGKLLELDSYVGMGGHGVIVGLDSELYMHMHPLGSISMSAQKKFMKSDTDDFICDFGLIQDEYGNFKELDGMGRIVFPSINLKPGNYRFFIQVKVKETQKIVSKQFDFSIS